MFSPVAEGAQHADPVAQCQRRPRPSRRDPPPDPQRTVRPRRLKGAVAPSALDPARADRPAHRPDVSWGPSPQVGRRNQPPPDCQATSETDPLATAGCGPRLSLRVRFRSDRRGEALRAAGCSRVFLSGQLRASGEPVYVRCAVRLQTQPDAGSGNTGQRVVERRSQRAGIANVAALGDAPGRPASAAPSTEERGTRRRSGFGTPLWVDNPQPEQTGRPVFYGRVVAAASGTEGGQAKRTGREGADDEARRKRAAAETSATGNSGVVVAAKGGNCNMRSRAFELSAKEARVHGFREFGSLDCPVELSYWRRRPAARRTAPSPTPPLLNRCPRFRAGRASRTVR